ARIGRRVRELRRGRARQAPRFAARPTARAEIRPPRPRLRPDRRLAVTDHVTAGGDEAGAVEGYRVAQPVDVQLADSRDALAVHLRRDADGKAIDESLA